MAPPRCLSAIYLDSLNQISWFSARHNVWAVRSQHKWGIEAWALCDTQTLGVEELWRNTRQQQAGQVMVIGYRTQDACPVCRSGKAQRIQQTVITLTRWGGGAVSLPNSKGFEIFSFALNRYTILSAWPLVDTNCSCVLSAWPQVDTNCPGCGLYPAFENVILQLRHCTSFTPSPSGVWLSPRVRKPLPLSLCLPAFPEFCSIVTWWRQQFSIVSILKTSF